MKLLNLKSILAVGALVLFGAAHASAQAVPSPCPLTNNASLIRCDVMFTINVDNSVTVTTPSLVPYDGIEDQLVGVVNWSSTAVSALTVTGPSGLFGFDLNGVCDGAYLVTAVTGCGLGSPSSDATGYGTASESFTNINGTLSSGRVNFLNSIAGNGVWRSSAWSLLPARVLVSAGRLLPLPSLAP